MCTSFHLSVAGLPFSYPMKARRKLCSDVQGGQISPLLQKRRKACDTRKPAQEDMTNHKNPDLAAQLGDLALDTRVQLRDLASRPELNGR